MVLRTILCDSCIQLSPSMKMKGVARDADLDYRLISVGKSV